MTTITATIGMKTDGQGCRNKNGADQGRLIRNCQRAQVAGFAAADLTKRGSQCRHPLAGHVIAVMVIQLFEQGSAVD